MRAESFAGVGAGGDAAFIAGEPDFAGGLSGGGAIVPGMKIGVAPDAGDEARLDEEGRKRLGG
jgi:hypothetical protein